MNHIHFNTEQRKILILLVLGLIACVPGTAQQDRSGQSRPPGVVRLQLKWYHQFQFAGYYMALEKGWYAQEGLTVEILEANADTRVNHVLAEGNAEYGVNASDILIDRARGLDLVVLGAIFQHSPLVVLATDPEIKAPDNLAGKRIMVSEGADTEVLSMLLNESMSLGSVQMLEHSWDLQDLLEGRVDAVTAYSTNEALILKERDIPFTMIRPLVYGIDFYGDSLVTTSAEIRDHPQRAAAFLRASLRGWEYALEHKEEACRLILERYSQRKTFEQLMAEAAATDELIVHRFIPLGSMNPGRWAHIADTYVRLGVIPANFNLKGFIYSPTDETAETRFFRQLSWGLGGTALLVSLVTLSLFAFNRHLAREVKTRTKSLEELNIALGEEITERRIKETALAASLEEKSILLREVHHRVKNNLQIIMSLVSMEMDKQADLKATDQLVQIRNRVYSMALVHESLYGQNDLTAVDLEAYLRTLAQEITQSYALPGFQLELVLGIDPIQLPIEQAIPLGLIVGELISNSMKHAFIHRGSGQIEILLTEAAGDCAVEIRDNGNGRAPDSTLKQNQPPQVGLGLVLIKALAQQLDGSLVQSWSQGCTTRIVFPLRESGPVQGSV